jgi:transcriptional regulator with XRE-family HTH domain
MSQKKHFSKVSDMVEATTSPEFAEAFKKHVAERQLVQKLQLMRAHAGLSQEDVAKKLGCTQSKVSKLESSTDRDLSVADLLDYASSTGHELQFVFFTEETKLVDEIKYHFFETRELMERMARLAGVDEDIAKGVAGFFGEAYWNFMTMLGDKLKTLPAQARDHVPLVKLVCEIDEKKRPKRTAEKNLPEHTTTHTNGHNGAKVVV